MKKIAIALSGGVDSAVAAYLLKKKGYEVSAFFLKLTKTKPLYSPSAIASFLGIPYSEIDLEEAFKTSVITPFIKAYLKGKTPNPCVWCNQKIKFHLLLEEVKKGGFNYLATGHYARKIYQNGRYLLLKGVDKKKDQSYFLFSLSQRQLSNIIWVLGELSKKKVKNIALSIGLNEKIFKESQEICFIQKGDYRLFLQKEAKNKLKGAGEILDEKGNILGKHNGLWRYTIGQRQGIGICAREPYYVKKIDYQKNVLVVAFKKDLFFREAIVEKVNLFPFSSLEEPLTIIVKIRYKQKETPAILKPLKGGLIRVIFKEPQFAVTVGQVAVFYQGDVCIGGGIIKSAS